MDGDDIIDAVGLICPLPVLRLRKALATRAQGDVVVLEATDRAALFDVPHFCAETGHALLRTEEAADGRLRFTVRKGESSRRRG
jgi:tRNA 2-thiouridine synthesizing protein A